MKTPGITAQQALDIRQAYPAYQGPDNGYQELARRFRVSDSTVKKVLYGIHPHTRGMPNIGGLRTPARSAHDINESRRELQPMSYPAFMRDPARGCAPGRVHPEIFFASPKAEETVAAGLVEEAKRDKSRARLTCTGHCPFTSACVVVALRNGESAGIWGGVDMASESERAKAAAFFNLDLSAPTEPAGPESDEVLVERILKSGPAAFAKLTAEQQAMVARAGLERGSSVTQLAKQFKTSARKLKLLLGENTETFEQKVRHLHSYGKSDSAIALSLEVDPKQVARARERLGLPALFGPGGRLRRRISDAQKAQRERVPA